MNRYVPTLQEYAPAKPYVLEELVDRRGVLALHLIDANGRKARLSFSAYVAYRKLDEGDAMVALDQISANAQSGRSFYTVEASDFVDWFIAQGHGVRDADALTHYVIVAVDDVIDVLALENPAVQVE